eukprot:gene4215-4778_t
MAQGRIDVSALPIFSPLTEPTTLIEQASNSSTDDEYLYTVVDKTTKPKTISSKAPQTTVNINNVPVRMIIDSGASTNILDESDYERICKHKKVDMTKSGSKIMAYGSAQPLPTIGKFSATLETKQRFAVADIHVVKGCHGSLLSYQTATDLGLINIQIVENDEKAKAAMKNYADTRNRSKESNINIGDVVLVKQPKRNKFTTRFNPDKYSVIAKNGTMITAENSKGHKITRNISFFRKVDFKMDASDIDSSDGYDDDHDDDVENRDEPIVMQRRYPLRNERRRVARFGQNIYDQ